MERETGIRHFHFAGLDLYRGCFLYPVRHDDPLFHDKVERDIQAPEIHRAG